MMNNRLILGMDIREDNVSLSCCLENQNEVINENYNLKGKWDGQEILGKMTEFLNKNHAGMKADCLVYSCENNPISRCKKMERIFREAGLGQKGIRLISKENAFVHYVMHQNEELHRHTVMAFEFGGQELYCYRLFHPNKKHLQEMKIEKDILVSFSEYNVEYDKEKQYDEHFAEIAKQLLAKEVVSAVFLTGQGFEGGWLKKSLKVLCDGRRAFFGQNLFSAGCCYYGVSLCRGDKTDYLIQAPETVLYDAGVIDSGSEDQFVKITESGYAWYETKGSIDVVMERGGKADVVFVHSHTQEKQVESVDISGLPPRARKTGRLQITVEFLGKNEGVITVKDKGFGQFAPSTNQIFVKEFKLL